MDFQSLLLKKSLWKEKQVDVWSFYCPQCSSLRKVESAKRPGKKHFFQIALITTVFMQLTWSVLSWKGIVIFLPLWFFFEVFFRIRLRALLSCTHCGFDPYLYLVDVKSARKEIDQHWRRIFQDRGVPFPDDAVNHEGQKKTNKNQLVGDDLTI